MPLQGSCMIASLSGRLTRPALPLHSRLRRSVLAASTPTLTAPLSGASLSCAALRVSQRTAKSRSLSPDDPFGERSSWEDPSDGLYSAWKDVDLEGFAAAANTEEVRQAHFGPEWARFATVGRLSVKKMNEDRTHAADGDSPDPVHGAPSTRSRPAAEVAHERELHQKQKLMQRNYMSYEAYLTAEYGDSGTYPASSVEGEPVGGRTHQPSADAPSTASALHTSAALEASFFETVDGHDARDRMVQRNPHRDALNAAEAAEVAEEMPLPDFMLTPEHAATDETTQPGSAETCDAAVSHSSTATLTEASTQSKNAAGGLTYVDTHSKTIEIPSLFVHETLRALGPRHGHTAIPLVDPIEWSTDTILTFLREFEHRESASVPSVMDETMCEAFVMASVDGRVLLDIVVPPRLFRVLRRWHTRRRDAIVRGHHLVREENMSASDAAAKAANECLPKLEEAVTPVDATLIRETILLCFPYGGGGRG